MNDLLHRIEECDPVKLRLFLLFNRRKTRLMDAKEAKAFRLAQIEEDDLAAVERWWFDDHQEWCGQNYRRRDLITLLHNWNAAVDKAEDWAANPPVLGDKGPVTGAERKLAVKREAARIRSASADEKITLFRPAPDEFSAAKEAL